MIEFSEDFDKFFTISATDIILNDDIDDTESYSLVIKREDLMSSDEDDDDDDDSDFEQTNKRGRKKKKVKVVEDDDDYGDGETDGSDDMGLKLSYYTTRFYVVQNLYNKKQKVIYEFVDKDQKELFMHNDMILRLNHGKDEEFGNYLFINLEDINLDEFIFMVEVDNNELTKPMKQIEKLIDNKAHEGCTTYEEMVQTMIDLLIQSGISATSVQGEMIIRQLVRKPENQLLRPDFTRLVMQQDYQILTVKIALKKDRSITTSLSTPYLKYQLVTMTDTFDKDKTSDFDLLFKRAMSSDPWEDESNRGTESPYYKNVQHNDRTFKEVSEWSNWQF